MQEEKDAHNAMAQENHLLKAALARLEDLMQATDADAVREARAQARAEAAAAAAAADGTGAGAEGPTRFRPDRPLDHDGGHVQPVLSKRQVRPHFLLVGGRRCRRVENAGGDVCVCLCVCARVCVVGTHGRARSCGLCVLKVVPPPSSLLWFSSPTSTCFSFPLSRKGVAGV